MKESETKQADLQVLLGILDGPWEGMFLRENATEILIGNGKLSSVKFAILNDPAIGKRHARLEVRNTDVLLCPLSVPGSRIWVEQKEIQEPVFLETVNYILLGNTPVLLWLVKTDDYEAPETLDPEGFEEIRTMLRERLAPELEECWSRFLDHAVLKGSGVLSTRVLLEAVVMDDGFAGAREVSGHETAHWANHLRQLVPAVGAPQWLWTNRLVNEPVGELPSKPHLTPCVLRIIRTAAARADAEGAPLIEVGHFLSALFAQDQAGRSLLTTLGADFDQVVEKAREGFTAGARSALDHDNFTPTSAKMEEALEEAAENLEPLLPPDDHGEVLADDESVAIPDWPAKKIVSDAPTSAPRVSAPPPRPKTPAPPSSFDLTAWRFALEIQQLLLECVARIPKATDEELQAELSEIIERRLKAIDSDYWPLVVRYIMVLFPVLSPTATPDPLLSLGAFEQIDTDTEPSSESKPESAVDEEPELCPTVENLALPEVQTFLFEVENVIRMFLETLTGRQLCDNNELTDLRHQRKLKELFAELERGTSEETRRELTAALQILNCWLYAIILGSFETIKNSFDIWYQHLKNKLSPGDIQRTAKRGRFWEEYTVRFRELQAPAERAQLDRLLLNAVCGTFTKLAREKGIH
jgi:hypothetical protein